jgi:hypothetical protein
MKHTVLILSTIAILSLSAHADDLTQIQQQLTDIQDELHQLNRPRFEFHLPEPTHLNVPKAQVYNNMRIAAENRYRELIQQKKIVTSTVPSDFFRVGVDLDDGSVVYVHSATD